MSDNKIPPPPEKPSANECCGGGCVPCIYDYYYDAFDRWNEQFGEDWAKTKSPDEPTTQRAPS